MKALKLTMLVLLMAVGLGSCIVPVPVRGGYHRGPGYYRGGPRYHQPHYHGPRGYGGPRRY